jgi:hypothetical protein
MDEELLEHSMCRMKPYDVISNDTITPKIVEKNPFEMLQSTIDVKERKNGDNLTNKLELNLSLWKHFLKPNTELFKSSSLLR